ncbi:UV radiation resistance protein and autophagy-related subunit 14-domain-containing protein [Schizothecium vesticola]|uniref:Autophagy-related protein 14 n=1 Tax=Schizothecium vesticola TaxID=314040 RepID=A0AA40F9V5_9PEZI|nr:UV radiation resistance protein and autophagy-related subunit 14-domain-containing protein [Schizothecium vesticola]
MNCNLCRRSHHPVRVPFLCAVDARNNLYERRVKFAKALIESEEAERQIEKTTSGQPGASNERSRVELMRSQEEEAVDRTSQIIAQAERLQLDVEAARREIEASKDLIARRRADLDSASSGAEARQARQMDDVKKSIQRIKYKWNRNAEGLAATRAFLCEEAARLSGLRQVKKGSTKRYEIGGVEIVELHAMNNISPEQVSTSLGHMAHILVLACHYLAIRLPAEITLPHRDYPRPTIFSLASSYRHGDISFPGSLPSAAGAGPTGHVPRPRPLFIDKPLSTLAKEDASAYSLFLEGVALLAYDIAWACCAQGVSFGDKESYDDISNMGQNLWRLLIGDQVHRRAVEPTFPLSSSPLGGSPREEETADVAKLKTLMGRWSHGTTYLNLGSGEGVEFIRTFKILSPIKLVDRLKKRLSTDAPMLEWETIEGHEADGIHDGMESEVLVRGPRAFGSESAMTTGTSAGGTDGTPTRGTGSSGWTKVKSR